MWSDLLEWGIDRIACYLKNLEAEFNRIWSQSGEYNETVLSLEIHAFFQKKDNRREKKEFSDIISGEYLYNLRERLKLSEFEMFCVIMALLSELDHHFEKLFVYLNNDWNQRLLSVEWAIRLYTMEMEVDSSYLSDFLPNKTLSQWVFDIHPEGAGSGLRKGLKLKAPVLAFLLGTGRFPDKPYLKWNYPSTEDLQTWLQADVCRCLEADGNGGEEEVRRKLFHLKGRAKREKFFYAVWYAKTKGKPLGLLDYRCMQEELAPEQVHMLFVEVVLAEGILCVHNTDDLQEDEKNRWRLSALLQKAVNCLKVIFLLDAQERPELTMLREMDYIPIEINPPVGKCRQQLWKRMAADDSVPEEALFKMSGLYDFGVEEIDQSLRQARRLACARGETTLTSEILNMACRQQVQSNLRTWAVRIERNFVWEDLVLPESQKEELREAVNQIKYRQQVFDDWGFFRVLSYGTGLTILLTGPPGTGKTMAAQVLAGELGMELYRIQLPTVVSKYIGETEKNLRQIFEEGKKCPAVLFFDEADILFSKRTEVKDSHDKYSNMEAAFLLQNMEEYCGVVILATNFPQNIDEAFKRRIKFTIEFYMPDISHRLLLWRKSFPEQLPLDIDVDLEYLAEHFELSGSNIKNIAVNAAFLAAPEGRAVAMEHIIKAVKSEYKKSGKYISEEEFML